jgi:enamine deaminase RidA (YjgF/YER057c/UK114 family)
MDMRAGSPISNPIRGCTNCTRGQGVCNGETVSITTPSAREVFIRCAPVTLSGSALEQARKFYECLPRLLDEKGASASDVVHERIFFRNVEADFEALSEARREAYAREGVPEEELPAASYVEQPPCLQEQAFELQVYAVVPNEGEQVRVQSFPPTEMGAMTKIVEMGDYRHLLITNINGRGKPDSPPPSFREQSDRMFEESARLIEAFGVKFPEVLRTWCYLDNIDRDYDEFNLSRNVFFEKHGVERLPASTGIRSGLYPSGTLCCMDLYALLNPGDAEIEIMHTPTLNEAAEYGSSFSRGMKVATPERTVLFISGTASVDEAGATVHINDLRGQIERMLLNIQELLKPHGATFADMAQIITYLKWRDEIDLFRKIWYEWGLNGLPNTFVEAGVCRPNLLCEMEAIAIIPTDR